jgi:hypothetical protein
LGGWEEAWAPYLCFICKKTERKKKGIIEPQFRNLVKSCSHAIKERHSQDLCAINQSINQVTIVVNSKTMMLLNILGRRDDLGPKETFDSLTHSFITKLSHTLTVARYSITKCPTIIHQERKT